MTKYLVIPEDRQKGWVVRYASGRTVSNHRTKRTALNAARRKANSGDTIQVHKSNGRIQRTQRVR